MRCWPSLGILAVLATLGVTTPLKAEPATPAAPATVSPRDPELIALSERWADRFVSQMGGVYDNPALLAYVSAVAARITAVSVQADEPWQVVLLDTPMVNAFARPGGYLYITRGMLAILADEDELAAILAHEVTHVDQLHFRKSREAEPDTSGGRVLGDLLSSWLDPETDSDDVFEEIEDERLRFRDYSRAQELEADSLGVGLLQAAGYDPLAMADALAAMFDWGSVDYGYYGYYDYLAEPDKNSDYPTDTERLLAVRQLGYATLAGQAAPTRVRQAYHAAISGMHFGTRTPRFERDGQRLLLNETGLALLFPAGYSLRSDNSLARVSGPGGLTLRIDVIPDPGDGLRDYVTRIWQPELRDFYPEQNFRIRGAYATEEQGFDAAYAIIIVTNEFGIERKLHAMVLRHEGRLIRIATEQRVGDELVMLGRQSWADWFGSAFARIVPLSAKEIADRQGLRIVTIATKIEDSVINLMADARGLHDTIEVFARLNRLRPLALPAPGTLVRIVTR